MLKLHYSKERVQCNLFNNVNICKIFCTGILSDTVLYHQIQNYKIYPIFIIKLQNVFFTYPYQAATLKDNFHPTPTLFLFLIFNKNLKIKKIKLTVKSINMVLFQNCFLLYSFNLSSILFGRLHLLQF